jgi:hypothetical protein
MRGPQCKMGYTVFNIYGTFLGKKETFVPFKDI